MYTATYSPEDDKIRLYATTRLDPETYARVKAAGFRWAPKQELFFCVWDVRAEDLAAELAGEIEDEDKTLVERAEDRAERFEGYSLSRAQDADQAHTAVRAIADHIPFGQPILVGHHSEKRARRDAEKIQNGMRKAVTMWKQSEYWRDRAAGALRNAKYKELPAVRARRIKKLEADRRRLVSEYTPDPRQTPILQTDRDGDKVPHVWCSNGSRGGRWVPASLLPKIEAANRRWIEHIDLRLAYERAMLDDQGGTVADQTKPEKGGAVKCWVNRGNWCYVQRVNKVSVTVLDNWGNGGKNFTRTIPFDKLSAVMTAADVEQARQDGRLFETADGTGFALGGERTPECWMEDGSHVSAAGKATDADFGAMEETLRVGVEVVSAPQLFPTPKDLARRMVDLADVAPGMRVLEPCAGTGALLDAIQGAFTGADCGCVVAIEINSELARRLTEKRNRTVWANESNYTVRCADFLECIDERGFDRIVMNPPFENGSDIKHILHALTLLKPGGRLVALCADGPHQQEKLKPLGKWESLPEGVFKAQGTSVRVGLLVVGSGS